MKTAIKISALVLAALLVLIGGFVTYAHIHFNSEAAKVYTPPALNIALDVEKADAETGKRIVTVRNGCVDCHGPDLGGHKMIDDPVMGTLHGANITPFKLSEWTDEQIAQAIRFGVGKDGRSLLFMPSYEYERLSREDLASVIAYLRTVPSVERPAPKSTAGPMAKVLLVLNKIPLLLPAKVSKMSAEFDSKPPEGPTPEFGRYLAESACIGCHGPELRGGPIPGGPPDWPPASSLRLGAHGWSEEDFFETIRTGVSAKSKAQIRAPMPVALLQQMTETEVRALWLYLSNLN